MMRKMYFAAAALAASLGYPAGATTVFTANLTTGQETALVTSTLISGEPRPEAFGTGTFTFNDAGTELFYTLTIFNIDFTGSQTADVNDNLIAAHIHAGPTAVPGSNAPVVFGFFGSPFNDNNPNNVVVTPFATGVGGMISGVWNSPEGNGTTLTAQIPNLLAGLSYVNFHTTQNPAGEIRGALVAVPEPATWAMMLIGFGALGIAMRRRRRTALA